MVCFLLSLLVLLWLPTAGLSCRARREHSPALVLAALTPGKEGSRDLELQMAKWTVKINKAKNVEIKEPNVDS